MQPYRVKQKCAMCGRIFYFLVIPEIREEIAFCSEECRAKYLSQFGK